MPLPLRPLLCGLLLNAPALRAQEGPAPRPVRDSAYAVHQLFREHRRKAASGLSVGLAGLAGAGFAAAQKRPGLSGGLLLVTAAFTVLDGRQLSRYGESREGLVVRQYEQGWPLPPDVRRRLKAKYFRAAP
jgi:hypothetical protein